MRSWSIPVGRLFGIEIRIHLTFLFLLVFLFSTEAATQDATAALRVLGLFGIVFGSVVLHELGHALVARGSGIPAKGIILLPIGGVTILDEAHAIPDPINAWKRDIRIAAAGPLVNLCIAGLSALDTTRGHTRLFAYREAAPPFERLVAEHRVGEPLPRLVQPVTGVSHGWRAGFTRRVCAPRRHGASHPARGPHRPRLFHFVHDGRNAHEQLVAGDDRVLCRFYQASC